MPGPRAMLLSERTTGWAVVEDGVHLVMLEAAHSTNGQTKLGAEMHRAVCGLEGTKPEDNTAVLKADVHADIGAERRAELVRRAG